MRISQVALEWAIAIQLFRKDYQRRALSYFSFLIATHQWSDYLPVVSPAVLSVSLNIYSLTMSRDNGIASWFTAVTATITNTTREGLRTYRFNLITFRFVKFFLTDRDSR